jgi:hypothetical protein
MRFFFCGAGYITMISMHTSWSRWDIWVIEGRMSEIMYCPKDGT